MRRILLALVIMVSSLFLVPVALAQNNKPQVSTLAKGVIVNRDHFTAGEVVEIFGTVNGDVYAAGGQVDVDGIINGDLLVVGGQIKISGKITGSVRAIGGQIDLVDAQVGKNVTIVGGNLDLAKAAKITGSLAAAGGNININADIGRDAALAGGNITIASNIKRDIDAASENIRLASTAVIGGMINYWSQNALTLDSGAKVVGVQTKHDFPVYAKPSFPKESKQIGWGFKLYETLSFLIIGLVVTKLGGNFAQKTVLRIQKSPWKTIFVGLVSLILIPIIALFLIVTIIGLPLGIITFTLFGLTTYLAKYFVMLATGEMILNRTSQKHSLYFSFILGLLVYAVLRLIPIVGALAQISFLLVGLGGMLLSVYEKQKTNKTE